MIVDRKKQREEAKGARAGGICLHGLHRKGEEGKEGRPSFVTRTEPIFHWHDLYEAWSRCDQSYLERVWTVPTL
jgi:hypothetical protein